MTQQRPLDKRNQMQEWSLAKKDEKSDVGVVRRNKRNDEHTAIPTSVAASIKDVAYKHRRVERVGLAI